MSVIPEGTIIDGIRIESVLGEGGMGVVYKGVQTTIGDRPIAIKFLKQDAFPDIETLKQATDRMRDEAIAASTVKSRHLVEVYQAGHSDQYGFYIAFEYLEGETLFERIQKKGVLSEREIIQKIAKPMLLALVALHDKEILHRDIKPANIQADNKNNYRLSDLGLAHFSDRNAKTATGTFIGTPGYLAPERLSGNETKESDVYSAAMTLVFAAIGRLPFTSQGYNIFQEQVNTPITPIKLTTLGVPAGLAQKLAPALGPVPESRPTAKELLDSLEQIRPSRALKQPNQRQPKQTSAQTRIAEQTKPTLNPQSPKTNIKVAIGLIGIIIIAVIGLVFLKPAPKKLSEFEQKFKNNWPPKPEMIDLFYKHVEKTLALQNPKEKLKEIYKIKKATAETPYKNLFEAEFYFSKNDIVNYLNILKNVTRNYPEASGPLISVLAKRLEKVNPYESKDISAKELALLYEVFAFLPKDTYSGDDCLFARMWAIHCMAAIVDRLGGRSIISHLAPSLALATNVFPKQLDNLYLSYDRIISRNCSPLLRTSIDKLLKSCLHAKDKLFIHQNSAYSKLKSERKIGINNHASEQAYLKAILQLNFILIALSSTNDPDKIYLDETVHFTTQLIKSNKTYYVKNNDIVAEQIIVNNLKDVFGLIGAINIRRLTWLANADTNVIVIVFLLYNKWLECFVPRSNLDVTYTTLVHNIECSANQSSVQELLRLLRKKHLNQVYWQVSKVNKLLSSLPAGMQKDHVRLIQELLSDK